MWNYKPRRWRVESGSRNAGRSIFTPIYWAEHGSQSPLAVDTLPSNMTFSPPPSVLVHLWSPPPFLFAAHKHGLLLYCILAHGEQQWIMKAIDPVRMYGWNSLPKYLLVYKACSKSSYLHYYHLCMNLRETSTMTVNQSLSYPIFKTELALKQQRNQVKNVYEIWDYWRVCGKNFQMMITWHKHAREKGASICCLTTVLLKLLWITILGVITFKFFCYFYKQGIFM
jgi:hypothetical protein